MRFVFWFYSSYFSFISFISFHYTYLLFAVFSSRQEILYFFCSDFEGLTFLCCRNTHWLYQFTTKHNTLSHGIACTLHSAQYTLCVPVYCLGMSRIELKMSYAGTHCSHTHSIRCMGKLRYERFFFLSPKRSDKQKYKIKMDKCTIVAKRSYNNNIILQYVYVVGIYILYIHDLNMFAVAVAI